MNYRIGQRFISEAEADLGLGMIQDIDDRILTLFFPAGDTTRLYAKQNAPLTRVIFKVDDTLPLQDGSQLRVCDLKEEDGIYFYQDEHEKWWPETQLSADIQLNQPLERLFSLQIDHNNLFELRKQSVEQKSTHRKRSFYGLMGARTSLLPHQLYIAEQTTRDSMPRVLLADEVGLGKTIEAGLILHRLLLLERVQRCLIIVPDALVHQWLVEMVRRFNLRFNVLSLSSLVDIHEELEQAQCFICPLSLATEDKVAQALIEKHWDILIVDEAHHLHWSPTEQDNGYKLVEALSQKIQSVLLLTATPEQLGIEGHFARLRLLDPERYPDFEQFLEEQKHYAHVANIASKLADDEALNSQEKAQLEKWVNTEDEKSQQLDDLIDRFGPGRALYRNTRQNVSGFKQRVLNKIPLIAPKEYEAQADDSLEQVLHPERYIENWVDIDPRVEWLFEIISQLKDSKAILICHHAKQILELEKYLWDNFLIATAVFHEDMDLIERDKAAAFFADEKNGAKILLCSEIGSEGRNFQFAHDLILFDLPFNCDLIEQRIGRLDRIGQSADIQIHVPYFENSASQHWLEILDQGLNVFKAPSPASQSILVKHQDAIKAALTEHTPTNDLVSELTDEREALEEKLNEGRDCLLELHSCHPVAAYELADKMQAVQESDETSLIDYMELFADAFGLEVKDISNQCISIQPGDHMLIPDLPHLPEDGFMATAVRNQALTRDDVQFLSWEHPFIQQALDIMSTSAFGNSAIGYVENQPYDVGSVFIELSFVAYCSAPKALQIERYLPPQALHIVMTPKGELRVNKPLELEVKGLNKKTALGLLNKQITHIKPTLEKLNKMGESQLDKMVALSLKQAQSAYANRIERIKELAKNNANMAENLINHVEQEGKQVEEKITQAQLKLDCVRLIFCS